MKYTMILGMSLLLVALLASGCDAPKTDSKKAESNKVIKGKSKTHAHGKGPNGGVVFDLGKYHAEFTVNHDKKECTVLLINDEEEGDGKNAKPLPVSASEFTVITKETKTKEGKVVPPMTIKLLPQDAKDGKAATFTGTDPGLANIVDFEGTVLGEIDGKPSQGEFKE